VNLMQRTRPEPIGPLAQLEAAAALSATTKLRLRPNVRLRFESDEEEVRLLLLDRTVRLPAVAADAVKVILTGAVITPSELPGLAGDQQLELGGQLLRAGVLVPA
jgi:lysine-specific demethylase/histidyl-hydroxylase NO66